MLNSRWVRISFVFIIMALIANGQSGQSIYGRVVEQGTQVPVIGANIVVAGTNPVIGSSTDPGGYFRINNVPVGRVDLRITAVGYEEVDLMALTLVSGKELQLMVEMRVDITTLNEVVIRGTEDRYSTRNETVSVSGRSFDPELTGRFAGSRNDPAVMARNFAGVSGANDGRNDLIIRGNSPSGMLWRVEGIDVPNPNHFASFGTTGGPVSILNYNTLGKSDFLTAAFPAEYGNALAGVFDLQIRDGNYSKDEYLGQIGFNGVEAGAEGPMSRKVKSSFLANFRYSTLDVFDKLGLDIGTGSAIPEYTDMTFKISSQLGKGRWSLWGIGGLSSISLLGHEIDTSNPRKDLYGNENQDIVNISQTGMIGTSYSVSLSGNSSFRLSAGYSHQVVLTNVDSISPVDRSQIIDYAHLKNRQNKISIHPVWYHKINARNNILAGVNYECYFVLFSDSVYKNGTDSWDIFRKLNFKSGLIQAYTSWENRVNDKLTLNTGLHYLNFLYNNSQGIEPRAGIKYRLAERHLLSLGFGVLHMIQPLPAYATTSKVPDGSYINYNHSLGFTRSIHYVIGYEYRPTPYFHLKTEVYYQQLSRVPVELKPTSFSMLNTGDDFVTPLKDSLVNKGTGRNFGIEFTAERTFYRHYYYLATASLFNSRYAGSDGVWRNTAFNGHYVINLLAGKEWVLGKKNNVLGFDVKGSAAGGRYYTPLDLPASIARDSEVRKDAEAYSLEYDPYFRMDVKLSFRLNRKKITHEFALDVQNVTNRKNQYRISFNPFTGKKAVEYQLGIIPVPQYRILF